MENNINNINNMEIQKKLINIQSKLNAPKSRKNNFGNYNYRSCEDILEAVKPLLKEESLTMFISDEIINIGDRYYIKAIVKLVNENNEIVEVSALARESEEKKGMDSAQITGATSSYARKYALNGLFLIDDTKDADTDEYNNQTHKDTKEDKKPHQEQTNISQTHTNPHEEDFKKDLGIKDVCNKCGADLAWSEKAQKHYCSKKCWLNK